MSWSADSLLGVTVKAPTDLCGWIQDHFLAGSISEQTPGAVWLF